MSLNRALAPPIFDIAVANVILRCCVVRRAQNAFPANAPGAAGSIRHKVCKSFLPTTSLQIASHAGKLTDQRF